MFAIGEFMTQGPEALILDVPKGVEGGGGEAEKKGLDTACHTKFPVAGSKLDVRNTKSPLGLDILRGATVIVPLAGNKDGILGRVAVNPILFISSRKISPALLGLVEFLLLVAAALILRVVRT